MNLPTDPSVSSLNPQGLNICMVNTKVYTCQGCFYFMLLSISHIIRQELTKNVFTLGPDNVCEFVQYFYFIFLLPLGITFVTR